MALQLVIGNKNYSSWSMRAGVLMHELGIPFEELKLRLPTGDDRRFHDALAGLSPAGRVPVLRLDDGFAVWDTLAIAETLHEHFPDRGVWPSEGHARARARSLCAEMHAGFGALRTHCPMNIEAELSAAGARVWAAQPALRQDVARLEQMWDAALQASGGPMLFGRFSAADAFFAPVAMRLHGYALPVTAGTRGYIGRLRARPAVAQWIAEALAEHDFIPDDEPYRSAP